MQNTARKPLPALFYRLASPKYFVPIVEPLLPWIAAITLLLFALGLPWALAFAPADYQQGNSFRIIYIHVPAAAFSISIYVAMAITGAISMIWRIKLIGTISRNCALIGAIYTFLALATGAIWGKPTWGTWWQWDVRLTSELILLFLYLGYIALDTSIENREQANQACGLLAVVGVINIPIIKYSVDWFNTLHQGATLFKVGKPAIAPEMLWPLLIMLAAFAFFALLIILTRTITDIYHQQLLEVENHVF